MKSPEQIDKIKAVVLYILQHFKDGVDYIKLFKIMYFAQREYLATYGLTIVEDTFKARQPYRAGTHIQGAEDCREWR